MSTPRHHVVAVVAKAVGLNVPQVKFREQAECFTSSSLLFFRWYTSSLYSRVGLSSSPPPPPPPPPPPSKTGPATSDYPTSGYHQPASRITAACNDERGCRRASGSGGSFRPGGSHRSAPGSILIGRRPHPSSPSAATTGSSHYRWSTDCNPPRHDAPCKLYPPHDCGNSSFSQLRYGWGTYRTRGGHPHA